MEAPARLEAMLDHAEQQIARLVQSAPDDPELLAKVDLIRERLEVGAGPRVQPRHDRRDS